MTLRQYERYLKEIRPSMLEVDVFDREENVRNMNAYMLNRTQSIFEYKNLPSTIPAKYLELYLQMNGNCCIADVDGSLYALVGGFGGDPDAYYLPVDYVVANPYLHLSKTFKRDVDCIVLMNDPLMVGLLPLLYKYNTQLADNELSMNMAIINARIMSIITGNTDQDVEAANKFIEDIRRGKLTAVMSDAFFEGIKVQPYATSGMANHLTDLIETEQYLRASMLNDLGLNANYNMKRESINSNESQLNDDMLSPFIDIMLKCRKEGIEKVNNMFGTDIEVDFASAWKENKIEHDIELLTMMEGVNTGGGDQVAEDTEGTENADSAETENTPAEDSEDVSSEVEEQPSDTEEQTETEETIEEIKEEIIEELQELVEDDLEVKDDVNENED